MSLSLSIRKFLIGDPCLLFSFFSFFLSLIPYHPLAHQIFALFTLFSDSAMEMISFRKQNWQKLTVLCSTSTSVSGAWLLNTCLTYLQIIVTFDQHEEAGTPHAATFRIQSLVVGFPMTLIISIFIVLNLKNRNRSLAGNHKIQ